MAPTEEGAGRNSVDRKRPLVSGLLGLLWLQ